VCPPDAAERDARELDDALGRCYRHLGGREHSVAELRRRLERAGLAAAVVEQALTIVTEQGYVNDERYARLLVEDRRTIDGWGAERIRARLEAAGIDRELIDGALAGCDHASELSAATAQIRRRCAQPLTNDRERQRAFGILIRLGFDSEVAYDAVRAQSDPVQQLAARTLSGGRERGPRCSFEG
jgi:regulatory protein